MKALISGVTGQDGSYLAEYLLSLDYEVIGIARRSSTPNHKNLVECIKYPRFQIVEGDITDGPFISGLISKEQPDEFYNLAAQSHVGTSFNNPIYTFEVNAGGFLNVLEAVRNHSKHTKIYQASTSELFGDEINDDGTQDENTPMCPNSPYAAAKLAAHNLARIYRESYNISISCGILFNHESERRGDNFVTQKVCRYIANLMSGKIYPYSLFLSKVGPLELHNLDSYRDWGYAPDYVKAMQVIIQHNDDFVVATGKIRSITDLLNTAFRYANIEDWTDFVKVNNSNGRPLEVPKLCGNASKIYEVCGWKPSTGFSTMINRMIVNKIDEYTK